MQQLGVVLDEQSLHGQRFGGDDRARAVGVAALVRAAAAAAGRSGLGRRQVQRHVEDDPVGGGDLRGGADRVGVADPLGGGAAAGLEQVGQVHRAGVDLRPGDGVRRAVRRLPARPRFGQGQGRPGDRRDGSAGRAGRDPAAGQVGRERCCCRQRHGVVVAHAGARDGLLDHRHRGGGGPGQLEVDRQPLGRRVEAGDRGDDGGPGQQGQAARSDGGVEPGDQVLDRGEQRRAGGDRPLRLPGRRRLDDPLLDEGPQHFGALYRVGEGPGQEGEREVAAVVALTRRDGRGDLAEQVAEVPGRQVEERRHRVQPGGGHRRRTRRDVVPRHVDRGVHLGHCEADARYRLEGQGQRHAAGARSEAEGEQARSGSRAGELTVRPVGLDGVEPAVAVGVGHRADQSQCGVRGRVGGRLGEVHPEDADRGCQRRTGRDVGLDVHLQRRAAGTGDEVGHEQAGRPLLDDDREGQAGSGGHGHASG